MDGRGHSGNAKKTIGLTGVSECGRTGQKDHQVCRANEWIGCLGTPSGSTISWCQTISKPRAKRLVSPSSIEQRPEPTDFMSLKDNHLIAARSVCNLGLIQHHQNRRKKKPTCISVRFANSQLCAAKGKVRAQQQSSHRVDRTSKP